MRKSKKSLNNLMEFIRLILAFQKIDREIWIPGTKHKENDTEHSYQLALTAWYLASTQNLKLNVNRLVKYALIHDLIEVYAGDTFLYDKNVKYVQSKQKRERAAQIKLAKNFQEFPDLHKTIEKYETKKDREGKFIYALDKILPIINIYLDNGKIWRHHKITLEMLLTNKTEKVALSPEIKIYFNTLVHILKKKERELFG